MIRALGLHLNCVEKKHRTDDWDGKQHLFGGFETVSQGHNYTGNSPFRSGLVHFLMRCIESLENF